MAKKSGSENMTQVKERRLRLSSKSFAVALSLAVVGSIVVGASPARAGFTITTSYTSLAGNNMGSGSSLTAMANGGGSFQYSSAGTQMANGTMMNLDLADQSAMSPSIGNTGNLNSNVRITITITQTGTSTSGTITVDDMLGGVITASDGMTNPSAQILETLSSSTKSIMVAGTTFSLNLDPGTITFNTNPANANKLALPSLIQSLTISPGIVTVPEPASATLGLIGLAGVGLAMIRRRRPVH